MATLSELVDAIAKTQGLEPPTVALIARYVREARLISQGGRGLSAAKMGVADAANLLIAVNTSRHAMEAASKVRVYRELIAGELLANPPLEGGRIYGPFGEAIERLIHAAGNDGLPETFLSKEVPPKLQEEFPKGNVQIDLKFRISSPRASLRITALANPDSTLRVMAEEMIDVSPERTLAFVFMPGGHPPRESDRREETTIGYHTLRAVGKLIQ